MHRAGASTSRHVRETAGSGAPAGDLSFVARARVALRGVGCTSTQHNMHTGRRTAHVASDTIGICG